jgi:spermidine/putrescine transport system substrate-binding protein
MDMRKLLALMLLVFMTTCAAAETRTIDLQTMTLDELEALRSEIDAAIMYTSQVTLAKMSDPNLKVVFPEEGIGFGIMAMFVPSQAPNSDAAHAFIEYILDPEISAKCYEHLGYYCTNKAAETYISEEYRGFLTLPSEFSADDMEMIGNITAEADAAHLDAFTAFREACN